MIKKKLQHLQHVIGNLDNMYESMASDLGNRVKCNTCKKEKQVDSAKCLRSGWPKCCGYTMTLLPPDKEK